MASLWQETIDDKWSATELLSTATLDKGKVDFVDCCFVAASRGDVLLFLDSADTQQARGVLLSPSGANVQLNNAPVENGIRVLTDHDAIRVAQLPSVYYTTERLARIEPYGGSGDVYCARCKMLISEGVASVACPQCGTVHHESGDAGCWTYAETCSLCSQATDLDSARFRWTPECL